LDDQVTRLSLILRLQDQRRSEDWETFAEIYQPFILRIARQLNLSPSDSHDAAQEVFLQLIQIVDRWSPTVPEATFRGWLYRVARHVVIQFLRREGRVRQQQAIWNDSQLEKLTSDTAQEAITHDREFRQQVFRQIAERIRDTFQPAMWLSFWRTYVENRSIADTARELNVRTSDVYVGRSRVLKKFRAEAEKIESRGWLMANDHASTPLPRATTESNSASSQGEPI
jgi:RNA polymerase sigma-70 factor, ECF subfamily